MTAHARIALSAADRAKLAASVAIVTHDDDVTRTRSAWQAAVRQARIAFEKLQNAEAAYVAATEHAAARDSTRRMPKNANPYAHAA
jgi:PHD/YefM family antitoxin component YafN of YafNO toxin-antitoxin module